MFHLIKLGEYRNFRSDDYTPIGDVADMYVALDRAYIRRYTDKLVSEYCRTGIIPTMNQIYARLYKDLDFKDYEEAQDENTKGVEVLSGRDIAKNIQNLCSFNMDDIDESFSKNQKKLRLRIDEKISENDYSQSKTGKAYKVFRIKNGKLYPPMVANAGGADTPVGVWLDAEEGEFAGLSKTGRPQVKSTGSGSLSYRPGWHMSDTPIAKQFDRSFGWEYVDASQDEAVKSIKTMNTFIKSYAKTANIGNIYYIEDEGKCVQVVNDNAPYFPYDFVWAECDYIMDVDYQEESDEQGYMRTKPDGTTYRSDKYQHSLAGLPKLPDRGYYKYRTNPNPDTVPWIISGQMRVTRLLDDFDVEKITNGSAPERQGGNKTLEELGLK